MGVVEDGRDSAGGRDSSRGVSRMSGSRPGSTRPMSSIRRRSGRPDSRHQGRLTTDRQVSTYNAGAHLLIVLLLGGQFIMLPVNYHHRGLVITTGIIV